MLKTFADRLTPMFGREIFRTRKSPRNFPSPDEGRRLDALESIDTSIQELNDQMLSDSLDEEPRYYDELNQ